MIRTRGLNHLNLAVADLDRSAAFYGAAVDTRERPQDLDAVLGQCLAAGATLVERGEFAPVRDPDGYTIEIWYE